MVQSARASPLIDPPLNLQHDGVVVALRSVNGEATTAQQAAALVGSVCTAALGYDQPVTAKDM